jgi:hypothetical protein
MGINDVFKVTLDLYNLNYIPKVARTILVCAEWAIRIVILVFDFTFLPQNPQVFTPFVEFCDDFKLFLEVFVLLMNIEDVFDIVIVL